MISRPFSRKDQAVESSGDSALQVLKKMPGTPNLRLDPDNGAVHSCSARKANPDEPNGFLELGKHSLALTTEIGDEDKILLKSCRTDEPIVNELICLNDVSRIPFLRLQCDIDPNLCELGIHISELVSVDIESMGGDIGSEDPDR
jgi:hypothetical protein